MNCHQHTAGSQQQGAQVVVSILQGPNSRGHNTPFMLQSDHICMCVCVGQAVQGVPEIQGELNPATWMLEITTPGMEHQLGVDFAQVYRESNLAK